MSASQTWRLNAGDETRIMDNNNRPICDVKCGGMSGRTVAEGEKIARLIAAAPALLEALEEQVGECFDPLCDMCARHAEIIALAKGESA